MVILARKPIHDADFQQIQSALLEVLSRAKIISSNIDDV